MTRVLRLIGLLALSCGPARADTPLSSTAAAVSATILSASTTPSLITPEDFGVAHRLLKEMARDLAAAPGVSVTVAATPPTATPAEADAVSEVLVTASAPRSPVSRIPSSVTLVPEEDFPAGGGDGVGEALDGLGLVSLQRYPAALDSIRLRGFATDSQGSSEKARVGMLFDGRPSGGANPAKFPLEGLERLEVVRGAGSALFGSSAMGGVVNLVPKRGRGEPAGTVAVEAGDFGHKRAALGWGGQEGPVDFHVAGSRLTAGDYYVPDVPTSFNADRDEWNGAVNVGVTPVPGHRIGLAAYGYFGDRLHNPGALTFPDDARNFYRKRFSTGQARYEGGLGAFSWDQTVYVSRENEVFHTWSLFTVGEGVDHYPGATAGGRHLVSAEHPAWGAVTAGYEWQQRRVESYNMASAPFQPRSRTTSNAVLAEGRTTLPVAPVTLSAGVRYDTFSQLAGQPSRGTPIPGLTSGSASWSAPTVRGGAVAQLGGLRLNASAGTGFRAPVAYERVADYTDSYATHYTGNPALTAETSLMTEAGAAWTRGRVRGGVSLFRATLDDKIASVKTAPTEQTWDNLKGQALTGVEVKADADLPASGGAKVTSFLEGTYHLTMVNEDPADVQRNGSGLPLNTPRWFGAAGVRAASGAWSGRLSAAATGSQVQWDFRGFPYEVRKMKPYAVWTAAARYRLTDRTTLYGEVENLFNARYESIIDFPQPRTTALAGVEVAW